MNGLKTRHAALTLVSFVSLLLATAALESLVPLSDDGNSTTMALNSTLLVNNSTVNGTALDGGAVPMVLTTITQIIAREGNCVLIDCNITGEPFPTVEWFNSHGQQLLDTESK